jgi:hypothetical protein
MSNILIIDDEKAIRKKGIRSMKPETGKKGSRK